MILSYELPVKKEESNKDKQGKENQEVNNTNGNREKIINKNNKI